MQASRTRLAANMVGYQLVWGAAVCGAGRQVSWPGVLAAALFAFWQLATAARPRVEGRLLVVSVALGVLLDGSLAATGVLRYAAPSPAVPSGGAPLWILALWVAFALTLNRSMRWLLGRPVLAVVFGAIGGPLAYAAAGRLAHAVAFASPGWHATTCLAAGWGGAMLLLTSLANRWARSEHARLTPGIS
ncbi:MAG: DUF2878 domain-containing protein [Proteobacteria bacterium]|nr:DUF2878 domain-containing protein [Pseudomonadota bacterium]